MAQSARSDNSSRLMLFIGCLWLLLAAGYWYYQVTNPVVAIEWQTDTEINTAGFNIYRSTSPNGDFVLVNEAEGLIPSEGSAFSGATYAFRDHDVVVNTTYYYLLEEVEYNQTVNQHHDDMLTHHVPYATPIDIVILTIMLLCGIGLIVAGLREERIA